MTFACHLQKVEQCIAFCLDLLIVIMLTHTILLAIFRVNFRQLVACEPLGIICAGFKGTLRRRLSHMFFVLV